MADAIELVTRLTAEVSADHDVAIETRGGMGRPVKSIGPETEKLFALVADAANVLGNKLEWRDSGGVCDGNNIASCGVPVIDTMGACGDFIHSPKEYLDTQSLVPKAQLTALVLQRLEQGSHLS
jgi:glutamate carboxypeptidase